MDIEVVGTEALMQAMFKARTSYSREHVTPYIREGPQFVIVERPHPRVSFPEGTMLSINTPEQYDRLFKLFEKLPENFTTEDIARLL
jgi:spore coat polysaccharide biosynthesis protein SpsF (cytidylyltransferase family)